VRPGSARQATSGLRSAEREMAAHDRIGGMIASASPSL
jgi:hypothetical protein